MKKIISFFILGLFVCSVLSISQTVCAYDESWTAFDTSSGWTGDYDTNVGDAGPGLKNVYYSGDYIFKAVSVPFIYMGGNLCALYGREPATAEDDYSGGTTTVHYTFVSADLSCSGTDVKQIDVYFYMTMSGYISVKIVSQTNTQSKTRDHFTYFDPRVSTDGDADTHNKGYYWPPTSVASGGDIKDMLLWKYETQVPMDIMEGAYSSEYPQWKLNSGVITESYRTLYISDFPYDNSYDDFYNILHCNLCDGTGKSASEEDCDWDGSNHYSNGPWMYNNDEDVFDDNYHVVHQLDSGTYATTTVTTQLYMVTVQPL